MRCTGPLDRAHQGGQALIEALVGLMALVPLVIATLWLGKALSMRQAAIEASRLLAFECTVRPADCTDPDGQAQLADEVRRRDLQPRRCADPQPRHPGRSAVGG
ncbi:MAG: hypothetical protein IPM01_21190 [Burkholderiaceae bacterium]|nr:hypothetical protein [Burkholderiaceae bacterium]